MNNSYQKWRRGAILLGILSLGFLLWACGGGSGGKNNDNDDTSSLLPKKLGRVSGFLVTGDTQTNVPLWLLDARGRLTRLASSVNSGQEYVIDFSQSPFDTTTFPAVLVAELDPPLATLIHSVPDSPLEYVNNLNPMVYEVTLLTLPKGLLDSALNAISNANGQTTLTLPGTDLSQITLERFVLLGRQFTDQLMDSAIIFNQFAFLPYTPQTGLPDLFLQTLVKDKEFSSEAKAYRASPRVTLNFSMLNDSATRLQLLDRADFQVRLGGQMVVAGLDTEKVTAAVRTLVKEKAQKIAGVAAALRSTNDSNHNELLIRSTQAMFEPHAREALSVTSFVQLSANGMSVASAFYQQVPASSEALADSLGVALGTTLVFQALQDTALRSSTMENILTAARQVVTVPESVTTASLISKTTEIYAQISQAASQGVDKAKDSSPSFIPTPPGIPIFTVPSTNVTTSSVPSTSSTLFNETTSTTFVSPSTSSPEMTTSTSLQATSTTTTTLTPANSSNTTTTLTPANSSNTTTTLTPANSSNTTTTLTPANSSNTTTTLTPANSSNTTTTLTPGNTANTTTNTSTSRPSTTTRFCPTGPFPPDPSSTCR